ncbi:MAG: 1-deoxy-D-xylulose-5-phosphate synthase [Puniceicoccales bacterium]|jgi:1-deoxy-D-xylulose-5-phosphate synthase|nr:1-deoxy-D-xylulose-5-phosphate synthase [Puniceicoccales bacterium]
MHRLLDSITSPSELKSLNTKQLGQLAFEIREKILETTKKNGGHLASNLGVVELTIALHKVFDSPKDQIVFDVSHQCYAHKLLTGRNDDNFLKIRQSHGYSGFCSRAESDHDIFTCGHSGTALSSAIGLAVAKKINNDNSHVIAVLGDASLTNGITLEGLNNISLAAGTIIVVLNDNGYAITENVGAIANYLNGMMRSRCYLKLKSLIKSLFRAFPGGDSMVCWFAKMKRMIKGLIIPSTLFEHYGLKYLGPVDGHSIPDIIENLEFCKDAKAPILLHVKTQKGRGLQQAIDNPRDFHGLSPAGSAISSPKHKHKHETSYQEIFGLAAIKLAENNKNIVAITAAMSTGTSLDKFKDKFPDRFFDVGIAEEHAITFSAGLSRNGLFPICAIYSTFLQRSLDNIIHDIALQNLPILCCIDRAGPSPTDGPTHHGLFDISYLKFIPGIVLMQPKDGNELIQMMFSAIKWNKPCFIRYPKAELDAFEINWHPDAMDFGTAEVIRRGTDVCLISLGSMYNMALAIHENLRRSNISCTIVNARFANPIDETLILEMARKHSLILTLEDHAVKDGFGSSIAELLHIKGIHTAIKIFGWPSKFLDHATSIESLASKYSISSDAIANEVKKFLSTK